MRPISPKVKKILLERKNICARWDEGECGGRITWEHAIIYAGRQLDEAWSIVKLCAYHHEVDEYQDGGGLNKELNVYIALTQATDDELLAVSKATDYIALRGRLGKKYAED